MSTFGDGAVDRRFSNVSTGDPPQAERIQARVDEARRCLLLEMGGVNFAVYPALQRADPALV